MHLLERYRWRSTESGQYVVCGFVTLLAPARRDKKEPAVREGAKQARGECGESQLVIHRKDGTIQDERTYRKDPYPPKG
jgi:hypothetical protein